MEPLKLDYATGHGTRVTCGLRALLSYVGLLFAITPLFLILLAINEVFVAFTGIFIIILSPLSAVVGLACAIVSRPIGRRTKVLRKAAIVLSLASVVGCLASIAELFIHMPG